MNATETQKPTAIGCEAFRKLGISESVLKVIEQERFEKPTKIQQESIPLIMNGKDVIGGSATGSGKTLAFGAGIIKHAQKGAGIQALILEPTRELAEQVAMSFKKFSQHKQLKVVVIYGGVSINPQFENLRTADIVIATPGRLLDHMQRRTIDFRHIRSLVLDEADVMLDMGFIEDVELIMKGCPKDRQTLMFSATVAPELASLAKRYMSDPNRISVDSYVDPNKLHQIYYDVSDQQKFALLMHLVKHEHEGLVMIFCNTRTNVDFVARNLEAEGLPAQAIHGGFSQDKRSKTMNSFHSSKVQILVCTDVAARGLDIKGVTHIYNYDVPAESKQYIHRIGRTARAGEAGKAITILAPRDHVNFSNVLRDFAVDVKKIQTPQIKRVVIKWKPPQRGQGRGGFTRRSGSQGQGGRSGPRQGGHGSQRRGPPRHGRSGGHNRRR